MDSSWIAGANPAGLKRWMRVGDELEAKIARGAIPVGRYLPGERLLAEEYGVSGKTVRRALQSLADKRLIVSEKRKGHKVILRSTRQNRAKHAPWAFVFSRILEDRTDEIYRRMLGELQLAADKCGQSLLGLNVGSRTPAEVVEHLHAAGVGGVVVDAEHDELLDLLQGNGMPVVMADVTDQDTGMDTVMQDSFSGGRLAAAWLAGRGHKQVAFIGHDLCGSKHALERFGGAVAGLAEAGIGLSSDSLVVTPLHDPAEALRRARRLLGRAHRPTACLALWQSIGESVVQAAVEQGLTIGCDLDVVSWSTEEDYASHFVPKFSPGQVPATVVWRVADMAEMCIASLRQRQANPHLLPVAKRVGTRLRLSGQGR